MEWFCTGPDEGTRFEYVEQDPRSGQHEVIKVAGLRGGADPVVYIPLSDFAFAANRWVADHRDD